MLHRGIISALRLQSPSADVPGEARHRLEMTHLGHIQAVTFDVGGTLIKPWPSVGHVYAEVAARHGLEAASPEQLNRQFAEAWREFKNFNHGREEWAVLVDRTFAGVSEEPPSRTF